MVREGQVRHLNDILMRRTALAVTGRLTKRNLRQIAVICAEVLGWDAPRLESEIRDATKTLQNRHRMRYLNA